MYGMNSAGEMYIHTYIHTNIYSFTDPLSQIVYGQEVETFPLLYDECMHNCILH